MKLKVQDNQDYDIIILAGQSNAVGNGLGESNNPWKERDDIYMLDNDYDKSYKRPSPNEVYIDIKGHEECYTHIAKEKGTEEKIGTFYLTFAGLYADKYLEKGRKVLIVNTPIGGTGFKGGHWGQNDYIYNRMLEMVDISIAMNKNNRVVCVLWHQGEHDAYENRDLTYGQIRDYYSKNFNELFNSIRSRYGSDKPFICGGFTPSFVELYKTPSEAVLGVLKEKMQTENLTRFVETDDLMANDKIGRRDPYHFCKVSLEVLGKRYFDAYEDIISKK